MLIRFSVRNFRSFADEQSFSFATSSDTTLAATHCISTGIRSIPRLAKAGIVFGANGSGKTNLIRAFAMMRDLVLHSTNLSTTEFAERHTPFLLGEAPNGSTGFEVDVLLEGVRYKYGFSYDQKRIVAERLLIYATGKSQRWFERQWDAAEQREQWQPFSQNFAGPRAVWRDATRHDSLFLSTAAQLNAKQLEPLFRWFDQGIRIVNPFEPGNLSRVAASLREDSFKTQMLEFLKGADIHVQGLRVPVPDTRAAGLGTAGLFSNKPPRDAHDRARVQFSHSRAGTAVWLDAADESTGILRLTCLFGPLLEAIEHGSLLLIDEFDLSLHPLVARYLIELVTTKKLCPSTTQLLLTTHNTTLMDVSILRRDEIWLMTLNDRDASELMPIWRARSPPRRHELIGNGYMRGRFGAVPTIPPEDDTPLHGKPATPGARKNRIPS